jgi:hypothetical protein
MARSALLGTGEDRDQSEIIQREMAAEWIRLANMFSTAERTAE